MKNKLNLTAKTTSKLTLKHTFLYAGASLGIAAILFTGAFLYFNLGNSEEVVASDTGFSSKPSQKGLWKDQNTWIKKGWIHENIPSQHGYYPIDVYGLVTHEGETLNIAGSLTLNVLDTLVIKGNLIVAGNAPVNISPSGVLVVLGNATFEQSGRMTNNGRVVVTGDLTTKGGGRVNNNASNPNGLYLYGTPNAYNGTNYGTNHKSEANLASNDPSLYKFVGNGGSLLPIVLSDFQASLTLSQTVNVEWSTFSEKNNDFFTVERSADGKNFEVLTTVEGAGNSNKKLYYSFEDKQPLAGYNYYRLKQTDFNGDYEYFKIVGVNNLKSKTESSVKKIHITSAWPNPFMDHLNISFDADGDGELEILVQNVYGEVVHQTSLRYDYGENTYAFDRTESLKSGIYFVTLGSNGQKVTQKVIKM